MSEPVVRRPLPQVTPARAALAIVGLANVVGLGVLGWFWRHPSAFAEAGGATFGHDHCPLRTPNYVGMTYPDLHTGGTITLRSATAHVDGSADAEIAFFVCTLNAARHNAVGMEGEQTIRQDCSSLDPIADQEMNLGEGDDPRQQLVMAISLLSHRGRIVVDGVDLTYSHGWQHGTQRIGERVEIASHSS